MANYRNDDLRHASDILKALGDESRMRMVMALGGRELCVCQIIEVLGLAPSTVSKHLYILKQAGLVDARKKGRWVYYCLVDEGAKVVIRNALGWLRASLSKDETIRQDARLLKRILKEEPEQLCRRLKKR